jgi:hypothetical protein
MQIKKSWANVNTNNIVMQTGGGGDATGGRGSVVKSEFDEAYFQQVCPQSSRHILPVLLVY